MKITKQIQVTVCDRCGKEGHTPNKCASCKKEISVCCSVHYEAKGKIIAGEPDEPK